MDQRVELAGVEMPPLPLGGMDVASQITATLRAIPATAFWVLDVDVDLGRFDVELHFRDLPRGGQAENLLIEIRVEHAPASGARPHSPFYNHPHKSPLYLILRNARHSIQGAADLSGQTNPHGRQLSVAISAAQ